MKEKKIELVVEELKKEFEIQDLPGESNASAIDGNRFMIDKRKYSKVDVLNKLHHYFKDTIIEGGYLQVESTFLVFTTFEIFKGKP